MFSQTTVIKTMFAISREERYSATGLGYFGFPSCVAKHCFQVKHLPFSQWQLVQMSVEQDEAKLFRAWSDLVKMGSCLFRH